MAGGASASSDDESITGINVTPFVDIALVLLVIFMVTARYITAQSIAVDLPEAASASDTQQVAVANIGVNAEGAFFVDAQPVDDNALSAAMRSRLAQNPELRAIINADRNSVHGRVTHAIDVIRLAGVTRFAITTTQPADAPETPSP
ncbi:MAG: biopolymer transporter ExbD [Deltaproteobacteria bacterium]|nr:biopolymer transporter ExbD [Deltaproteobacteria bacterium]